MKKIWLMVLVLISSLFLVGCSMSNKRSAIEINSYPVAKVFINGKEMGLTPYRNRNMTPGEIEIKLESNGKNWTRKIKLQNNISTVVDWEFGNDNDENGGYILYLEKTGDKNKAGLLTNTIPNKSTITIDNEIKGMSPLRINDIGQGDKHVALSYPGRKTVDIFAKSLKGYQLIIEAVLIEDTVTEINNEEQKVENPDLVLTTQQEMIKIKETGTGWLRVRESGSLAAKEVEKVDSGSSYPLLEEITGWYKIDLGDNKSGWVSTDYSEKSEKEQ